ncbi:MAG: alpha/beta hydrolase, partial [Bacteroidetes bacterium]|nr:alpha/beta hydrolase [Bacteroidota bacterium]
DEMPCASSLLTQEVSNTISIKERIRSPQLWYYPTEKSIQNTAAVLVLPGGGYQNLAFKKEGTEVAQWLNTLGISAFVLMYRTPYWESTSCKKEIPLSDAKQAMRIIRYRAREWNINPNNIGVMGFSAGGHLAATLSTQFDYGNQDRTDSLSSFSTRPDFSVLVYPVISMRKAYTHMGSRQSLLGENPTNEDIIAYSNELQVKTDTPPAILIHASNDRAVHAENSIMYYKALLEKNVPAALHIWEDGGHGFGLHREKGSVKSWPNSVHQWFIQRGILKY